MKTSARQSYSMASSSRPLFEESAGVAGVGGASGGCHGAASSPRSAGEPYYESYDSDGSHLNLAGTLRSSDREARKKAEKDRRTTLNTHIGELASLVPLVAESTKKVDKTSILRLAAHDLRKEHVFGDSVKPCHSDVGPGVLQAFLELMGGFLLTITVKGLIVVVSSNIVSYLGYTQIDFLGQNILGFTHPDDVERVKENLKYQCAQSPDGSAAISTERRDFLVRLARAGSRSEPPQYSVCRVDGSFRRSDRAGAAGALHPIRRQRVRKDRAVSSSGNDVVFVGLVRVLDHSVVPSRLLEASKQEYWTRHLVDGRIVHCDQRISLVAGYMSEEVIGVSAFTFMHKDDVRWVVIALRQMYDGNNPYGESCYRLVSRTGHFMYLRTKGFLEIDRTTKAAQSFVCINSLVSEKDGMEMISEMRNRYLATIDLDKTHAALKRISNDDEMGVEDPKLIEKVIINLISHLDSKRSRRPSQVEFSLDPENSPQPSTNTLESLTIIPPTQSDVKSSIMKSISVMSLSGALKRSGNSLDSACKRLCRGEIQPADFDKDLA